MGEEVRTLEEQLLQPEFRRDRAAVAAVLAEEFVEFGSSGRVYDKQQILDLLQTEAPVRAVLTDFQARLLTPGTALVTYRAIRPHASPAPDGKIEIRAASLRSSVWVRRDGRWQMIFHQGTPEGR